MEHLSHFTYITLVIQWSAVWIPLVVMLVLLVCSAMISSSEVAFFSLSPSQREQLSLDSSRSGRYILDLLEKPDRQTAPRRLLATILIVNNLVNIAIVLLSTQVAEVFLAHYQLAEWIEFLINVVLITFLLVMFGEVIPKLYATGHNLNTARLMALPVLVLQRIFSPLSRLLIATSQLFERRVQNKGSSISVDDLGHALELTANDERSDEEHRILEGIVSFGAKDVGQIMTPRMDIAALSVDESFEDVLKFIRDKGYSRIPVYRESIDKIEGFLFIKDLLPHLSDSAFDWTTLLKMPFFVPEHKKIDDLLQQFQKEKVHLAIVVDEYGGTSGLVTLEDILEEVVGDIRDEFDDDDDVRYSRLDDRNIVFEGKIALVDFYKILDTDFEIFENARGDNSTLGGFIVEQAGRIPGKGEQIHFEGFLFTIEAADQRRIKRIKVTLPARSTNNR
ncbi:MAG: gliding motility-associated protein GldE [Flavobacteriales bacterium]|nr:gliding motility-associated protein GldE [Flavobacteriales bacterium]